MNAAAVNAPYLMTALIEPAMLTQSEPDVTRGLLALVTVRDDNGKLRLVVAAKMLWN